MRHRVSPSLTVCDDEPAPDLRLLREGGRAGGRRREEGGREEGRRREGGREEGGGRRKGGSMHAETKGRDSIGNSNGLLDKYIP